jgi:hypothetical protein
VIPREADLRGLLAIILGDSRPLRRPFLPVSDIVLGTLKGSSRLGGSIWKDPCDTQAGAVEGLDAIEGNAGCEVLGALPTVMLVNAPTGSDEEREEFVGASCEGPLRFSS